VLVRAIVEDDPAPAAKARLLLETVSLMAIPTTVPCA